jgi:hypothetical protein
MYNKVFWLHKKWNVNFLPCKNAPVGGAKSRVLSCSERMIYLRSHGINWSMIRCIMLGTHVKASLLQKRQRRWSTIARCIQLQILIVLAPRSIKYQHGFSFFLSALHIRCVAEADSSGVDIASFTCKPLSTRSRRIDAIGSLSSGSKASPG